MILLNALVLACQHHEMDPSALRVLQYCDSAFGVIFIVECLLKILGFGIRGYFRDSGNQFDFLIVSFIVLEHLSISNDANGASALRGIRVLVRSLRVARTLRVLVSNPGVKMVIETIRQSGTEVISLSGFALFVLCVISIVGGQLLGGCFDLSDEMPTMSLHSFGDAFQVNFVLLMGESWSDVMVRARQQFLHRPLASPLAMWRIKERGPTLHGVLSCSLTMRNAIL
eukprot:SAG11_NODE_394_length_9826_cov_3.333607_3_plen_227_part_00